MSEVQLDPETLASLLPSVTTQRAPSRPAGRARGPNCSVLETAQVAEMAHMESCYGLQF